MRWTLGLPTDHVEAPEEFVTGPAVAEMAAAAEAAGYASVNVTDHPAPDAKWLATGGHHALDPMVALAFAAAATTTVHVQTHVFVAAYRNPLLAAKSVLSLDVLSGGRLILGVAAGYLRSEFNALGVDFEERNELLAEAIEVMRRAWREDEVAVEGRHFRSRGTVMRPRPARGGPPIWIGGNSTRALRLAAEQADGWVPFPNPPGAVLAAKTPAITSVDDLAVRIARLREHEAAVGRTSPIDVCFAPFALDVDALDRGEVAALVDEVHALAGLGVTWMAVALPAATRAEWLARCERFAELVVAPTA